MDRYDIKTTLPYFYSGIDINKFKFYAVPQILFDSAYFNDLSMDAKVLYCLMFDRAILSQRNPSRFSDEEGRVYIVYPWADIIKDIQRGRGTVSRLLKDLEAYDMIERFSPKATDKKNRIYVKNILTEKNEFLYSQSMIDKYMFYTLPKEVIGNPVYKSVSLSSKVLYMFLIERVKLSKMNEEKYSDEKGRVYIVYGLKSIMERMRCSKPTAIKLLKDLEDAGLIKRAAQTGYNTATRIYVLDFASGKEVELGSENVETLRSSDFLPQEFNNFTTGVQTFDHESSDTLPREFNNFTTRVQNFDPNNTNNNNTDKSYSHQSDTIDFRTEFFKSIELNVLTTISEELLSESVYDEIESGETKPSDFNKRYDELYEQASYKARITESMATCIVRFVNQAHDQLVIGGEKLPKKKLVDKLLSADSMTFEMARDKYLSVESEIRNPGAYSVSILLEILDSEPLIIANKLKQIG